jgi:hypothetical protein
LLLQRRRCEESQFLVARKRKLQSEFFMAEKEGRKGRKEGFL